jgi:hypothetical protein
MKSSFFASVLLIFTQVVLCLNFAQAHTDRGHERRGGRDDERSSRHCRRHCPPTHNPPVYQYSPESLFTVSGVRLGYTTPAEVQRLGGVRKDYEYNYYVYQGMNFWYHKSDVIYDMYFTKSGLIPNEWTSQGINFLLSYNETYSLLSRLGFQVTVKKSPTTEWIEYTRESFYAFAAQLVAKTVDRNGKELVFEFDFNYARGTENSSGTLYSINARATP